MENATNKNRIWELDFIRGCAIVLMIFDHTMVSLGYTFFREWFPVGAENSGFLYQLCLFARAYWNWPVREALWPVVVMLFIGICAICCSFSRSNLQRGLKLVAAALLISAVTLAADALMQANIKIIFGVLHMLGLSILLYAGLRKLGVAATLTAGLLLIAAYFYFNSNPLPDGLLAYILGAGGGFYTADHFPILPWCGIFLLAACLGQFLYKKKSSFFPKMQSKNFGRPLLFIGRHSLWFYLLHQPLIYAVLFLLGLLL